MPRFSTIIPLYNRGRFIGATLDSALAQEFADFEIIVVDDQSTDEGPAIVERFADPRVRLIRQTNAGPGVARNTGAHAATGEYIAFLDSDDVWFPWTLSVYAQVIERTDRPAVLAGRLRYFWDPAELTTVRRCDADYRAYPDYFASHRDGLYCGSGQAVIRRDVFDAVGGFVADRINAEDHDLTMRLGTAPGFVCVQNPDTIGYRQHAGSMTTNPDKTYEGLRYLLEREAAGAYPGGDGRRRERRRILAHHVRPASLALLRAGQKAAGWDLYHRTFGWQLRMGRWRYLAGFPAVAVAARRPAAEREGAAVER